MPRVVGGKRTRQPEDRIQNPGNLASGNGQSTVIFVALLGDGNGLEA
jgi:hypothetical protein